MTKTRLEEVAIIMERRLDDVAVAKRDIPSGSLLGLDGSAIKIKDFIKTGQRFALKDIRKGEYLRQYGYPFAQSWGVRQGELISLVNIKNRIPAASLKNYRKPAPTIFKQEYLKKTFLGYLRKDNRAGTRNYYLIIPASMCASETALQIAIGLEAQRGLLKKYKGIDGIVAIPHTEGCGCDSGIQINRTMLVLKNYLSHPNVGGCLLLGLGCEQTNRQKFYPYLKNVLEKKLKPMDWITIQDSGGTKQTIEQAKRIIAKRLSQINRTKRKSLPLSKLILGTECGASDSFSGISANPLIGNAADKVVYAGGAVILTEVTEMLGTFGMLLNRFRSLDIARKFQGILGWYSSLARRMGLSLEPNLVPENIKGGLINNYIKSLGAVMKGGSTAIEDVIDYAESLKKRGLTIMQGPGNDPESVTGMVASGVNIICFSTGKGTITGDAICPVIKIATNENAFRKLSSDMDFDASRLFREETGIDKLGEELLGLIIKVASGQKTWSEKWKQRQFQIWTAGKLSL